MRGVDAGVLNTLLYQGDSMTPTVACRPYNRARWGFGAYPEHIYTFKSSPVCSRCGHLRFFTRGEGKERSDLERTRTPAGVGPAPLEEAKDLEPRVLCPPTDQFRGKSPPTHRNSHYRNMGEPVSRLLCVALAARVPLLGPA